MNMEQGSCSVRGALAVVLRLTASIGVTPARLKPCRQGYVLQYSPARYFFACLFYGLLSLFALAYTIWSNTINIMTVLKTGASLGTTGIFFCVFVCVTVVSDTAMVFKGMKHIKELIVMLNSVQKLDLVTKQQSKVDKIESRRKYLAIVYLFVYLIVVIMNMTAKISYFGVYHDVTVVSTVQHLGYTVMLLHSMQFMFVALLVHSSLQSVNLSLGELYLDLKQGRSTGYVLDKSQSMPEEIRRLANTYSTLCDAVRELNGNYGGSLLITLCLIVFLFGWIGLLLVKHINVILVNQDVSQDKLIDAAENVLMSIIQVMNVIFLIEPCHRTHNEMQITKTYVTEILHYIPNYGGPVVNELEMFSRLIVLERASYSPLKICTMERLLVLKMIGGITSYVVIVLQLDM